MKNMKRIFSLFLSLIMLFSITTSIDLSAYADTSGDFNYSVSGSNATITGYTGSATSVTIPSEIDGYTVTSIGYKAFYKCTSLTSVTIPNSVTSIGSSAFYNCSSLTSVTIPDSVTSIGGSAFAYCTSLTSVTIPDSVTRIGDEAFYNCSSITSVTISDSVTSIGSLAFSRVNNIEYHSSASGSPWGAKSVNGYVDGYLVYKDSTKKRLLGCSAQAISVILPDSVTSIGYEAFYNCSSLTSVTIPDSVKSIGSIAFSGCSSLENITVGIGNTNYSSVDGVLLNKAKTILIQYPIGNSRTSYTVPNGVTSIGNGAFSDCTSLTSVTIPNSVKSVGMSAFASCTGIKYVFYSGSQSEWTEIYFDYYNDSLTSAKIHYNSTYHTSSNETITKQANCIENGIITGVCTICNESYTKVIPAFGHNYLLSTTKEATCTENGEKTYICSICNDRYTETITAQGHNFSSSSEYCQNGCGTKNPGYDVVSPTGSISSTNNVASSQTVTLSMSDNIGIAGYYWGTNSNYSSNTYTSSSSSTATKTVSSSGTYYFTVKDTSGNVSTTYSVTFYKTTLNANGGTVSPSYVITKSGNSFVRPTPTKTNYTFNGWATSSVATSGSTSSITPTSNTTYYATWTHTHKYNSSVTKEATCTVNGVRTYTCSICNDSYTETIYSAGHNYTSRVTQEATCTANGVRAYSCTVCNDSYTELIEAPGHSYTNQVVPPTCTAQGYTNHTCSKCGYSYKDSYTQTVSHNYTSRVTQEATCTENGVKTFTCTVCGDSYTTSIAATGHSYTNEVIPPTCIAQGYTNHTCSKCGYSYKDSYTQTTNHNYKNEVVSPTCTAKGYTSHTCTVCGDIYNDSFVGIIPHSYSSRVIQEVTCTENGVRTYTCTACNDSYTDVIEAPGHSYTDQVVPPTCTAQGYTNHTCTKCGYSYKDSYTQTVSHNYSSRITQEATCTVNGVKTYTCSVCNDSYTETITATGHSYSSEVISPTCTAKGYTKHICSVCGDEYNDKYVDETAHSNKVTVSKATLSENGSVVSKCSKCGKSTTQVIYYPKTVSLSATSYTYDGKVKTPSVKVVDSNGKTISSSNYTVLYASGRKNVGKYAVKITFKGNYSGSKTLYFTINPKGTSISSLSAGSKKFTVKWKKQSTQTTGYQIQYSTSSKFTNAKTVTLSKNSYTSKSISKLSAKKKYYVRVRTYKKVGSTNYYSSWSKAKSVTTKK